MIELLVVIAIIALLVGILLPSLSRAKELARTAVCKAHVRGAAQAMPTYTANHKGYLAGPNTSGNDLRSGSITNTDTEPNAPIQNCDWISPTLADSLGLPHNQIDRLKAIFNTKLRCPSNAETYDEQFGGSSFPDDVVKTINYASYSVSLGFHLVGDEVPDPNVRFSNSYIGGAHMDAPDNYRPKIERIGTPSEKIYVFEGARYTYSDGRITFNAFRKKENGGNYMCFGAAAPLDGGDPFNSENNKRNYVYKHLGETMNVSFFDGHVDTEEMNSDSVRDINKWFPRGFYIRDTPDETRPNNLDGTYIR